MIANKNYAVFLQLDYINQTVEFTSGVPLRGWSELSSLSLTSTGITPTRSASINVSYSIDGIHFSDFAPLSAAITAPIKSDFFVIIRITRTGTDTTGTIVVSNIAITGQFEQSYFDVWDMSGTIFSGIEYDNERWNKTAFNLLKKIYQPGIVPEYIERGPDLQDSDYIEFWKWQCYFWALTIELAYRNIEGLKEDRAQLMEFLSQKTLLFCSEHVTLPELQYMMENFWDEIRQRGTYLINFPANVPLGGGAQTYQIASSNLQKEIDGEMLRYLCHNPLREHVFGVIPRHLSGWVLDQTSPNYYAYEKQLSLNKAPEFTSDFIDLSKFMVFDDNFVSLDAIKDGAILTEDSVMILTEDGNAIVCDGAAYGAVKIEPNGANLVDLLELEESNGGDFFVQEDSSGFIKLEENLLVSEIGMEGSGIKFSTFVSSKLCYEFSMYIWTDESVINSLSVWVKAFDTAENQVALLRSDGYLPVTLEAKVLFQSSPGQSHKMWLLKFFVNSVYSDNTSPSDTLTNWGSGNNLRFYDTNTNRLELFILNQGENTFWVWDLKMRPFGFDSPITLDNYNQAVLLSSLNNTSISKKNFVEDTARFLLPYGVNLLFDNQLERPDEFFLLTELGDKIQVEESSLKIKI